jgi:hypothetical protein
MLSLERFHIMSHSLRRFPNSKLHILLFAALIFQISTLTTAVHGI